MARAVEQSAYAEGRVRARCRAWRRARRLQRVPALRLCTTFPPKACFSNEEWQKVPAVPTLRFITYWNPNMTVADHKESGVQGVEAQYRQALDEGRFLIQRCAACERAVFYPRMLCPHCGADKLGWITPDGRGAVYSTTVVRRKPDAGGDYNVALIDLHEGVRLMSRVEGIAPADVRIGMAVRARVVQQDGHGLVVFDPAPAGASRAEAV